MSTKKNNKKVPQWFSTNPSVSAIVFFIITTIIILPGILNNKTAAPAAFLFDVFLLPFLTIIGLYSAFHFGIAVAKIIYAKHKNNNNHDRRLLGIIAILLITQVVCIAICVGIVVLFAGYPVKQCFNVCQTYEIGDILTTYLLPSIILSIPAYYGACRYSWLYSKNKKVR
ncbi:hypothetical protein IJS18_02635 [Candidatus Saccharibacteria bacterium]|nr:hypothetical protein [Candidatus Saccharibacteria bacterium]